MISNVRSVRVCQRVPNLSQHAPSLSQGASKVSQGDPTFSRTYCYCNINHYQLQALAECIMWYSNDEILNFS